MARPGSLSLRITKDRDRWLCTLCRRLALEPSSKGFQQAIDYALMRITDEEGAMGTMETADRVQQVNWLRDLAGNIAAWGPLGETAEALVEYARSDEGTRCWDITWPLWFDAHDARLLAGLVALRIA